MNIKVKVVIAALAGLCAASASLAGWKGGDFTGGVEAIKDPECIDTASWAQFTVGGQYRDSGNGVPLGEWSMLTRWQGANFVSNSVTYDMGRWSGLHGVSSSGQRGYQTENTNGTPGVQVKCYDIGMLINTWNTPHRPIVGGGYNDMWGYAWSTSLRPRPFLKYGIETHLILQANIGVGTFLPSLANTSPRMTSSTAGTGQTGLFAYVRDTSHPSLPPIAIIAGAYDSALAPTYATSGLLSFDYNNPQTTAYVSAQPNWFLPGQTGDGVWFASGPISKAAGNTQQYVDTYYTDGQLLAALAPIDTGGSPAMPFFRAHVSPANMRQIITEINAYSCPAGRTPCLPTGYSANLGDYVLEYAGIYGEVTVTGETAPGASYDISPAIWTNNNTARNQVGLAVHGYGFGVYRGFP